MFNLMRLFLTDLISCMKSMSFGYRVVSPKPLMENRGLYSSSISEIRDIRRSLISGVMSPHVLVSGMMCLGQYRQLWLHLVVTST